jgi:hypothetical protein
MTSVQVLDGLLDTAIRDDLGRLHGTVLYQGDWYSWRKGHWTARVYYNHGVPRIPVEWLSPLGWVLRRSLSFTIKDGEAVPFGWTRYYVKVEGGWTNREIESEGPEGEACRVKPFLSYANGGQHTHRDNGTTLHPITKPPPPPDEWPETWRP